MNVLVTGSTGCLGNLLVACLRKHQNAMVWTSGRSLRGDKHHIACDLLDVGAIDDVVSRARPDLIFHLAGSYTNDYAKDLAVNAESARHLLDAARRRRMRPRTVLVGSAAEYGLVAPDENPIAEERVLRPVSLYGATKAFQTVLACLYAHQYGMDVVVARLFNLYARDLSERLFVGRVEQLVEQFKRGECSTIEVGDLSAHRDYIDGEEALDQLILIATRGLAGEVYNVGSGNAILMRDLLARMLNDAGLDMNVVRENATGAGRAGYDLPVIYADTSKTRRLRAAVSQIPEWH